MLLKKLIEIILISFLSNKVQIFLHFSFVGNSCFACTVQSYNTTLKDWFKLHSKCVDINGYKGRMAFVKNQEQINELVKAQVIRAHGRYFIGAKQDPPSDCGGQLCRREKHMDNWYYIDDNGEKQGKVSENLWLRGEPNNQGEAPPENVVTLEQFDSQKLGFNDGNGEQQNFPILCEYVNLMQCKEGYILIDNKCYKVTPGPITPKDAEEACKKEGGVLPSIHNDKRNTFIARYARESIAKAGGTEKGSDLAQNYGGILFGMKFESGKWINLDGSNVDYFRWFAIQGKQHPNLEYPPRSGYSRVALSTRTQTKDGIPAFGYWLNLYKETDEVYAYVCQTNTNSFEVKTSSE
uniref:C-type lectin domain-containing protein n=1 Tax=Panagrolaimus sp. ES5 TaxID=591445 RepID=A0AC34G1V4_9BILA